MARPTVGTTVRFNGFTEPKPVLTVQIEPTLRRRVRTWLALRLIGLATWVLGVGLKIKEMEDDAE